MLAAVVHAPGGVEALTLERRAVPRPRAGEVLIAVRAFGLNRSDLFFRRGLVADVSWPRVLGIEAVGEVVDAPGTDFTPGMIVATAMGGLGRSFDGGYAEFCRVPQTNVLALRSALPWAVLGALPVMLQTAWHSLFRALRLHAGERLLIRGGTTAIGLAALALARAHGATVAASTRRAERVALLRAAGAAHGFVDDGKLETAAHAVCGGFHKVLDLVGTTTLRDSLRCAKPGGVVCMTGVAGDGLSLARFSPFDDLPAGVRLTAYSGGVEEFVATPLQHLVDEIAAERLKLTPGRVFPLAEIHAAHRCLEAGAACGKIVVLT